MELTTLYKSVLDGDRAPVVLCGLDHTVLYMNPAAVRRYAAQGGASLLGKSLLNCHTPEAAEKIRRILARFEEDPALNLYYEFRNDAENKDVYMAALRDESGKLLGYYEKHEYRSRETAKLYDFVP